jgi:hypothetical protein
MKTLIKISPPLWPMFEGELDIISQELDKNHDVTILVCNGKKNYCIANPKMNQIKCMFCKSRLKNGLKLIEQNFNKKIIQLKEEKFDNYKFRQKFSLKLLKNFKIDNIDFGNSVYGTIITQYKDKNIDIKKKNLLANILLDESIKSLKNFKNLLKFNYTKILIYNGRHYNYRPILRYCQKNKLNAYCYDYPYHTHNGYLLRKLDFTQNLEKRSISIKKKIKKLEYNKIKKEGFNFLNNRINKKPTGAFPVFNINQKKILPSNLNSKNINIIIFNVTGFETTTISENNKFYLFKNQIKAVEFIISRYIKYENIKFFLRYHPNAFHETKDINEYKKLEEKFSNFTFIEPFSKVSSHYLIKKSHFVISFGSTVGLEAVFLKKNLITLGPSSYMKFNIDLIPKTKRQLIKDVDKCIKKKTQTKKQFFNSIKAGYALKYEHEKFKFLNNKGFYDAEYNIKNQKIRIKKNFPLYILYNLVYWYDLMCNIIKELTVYPKRLSFLYKNYSNKLGL